MEVRLAEHFGMCFGVRDAISLAQRLLRQGPLTIFGDLVHNPDVLRDLAAAGASQTSQVNEIPSRALLITAHGTSRRTKLQLRAAGHQVNDSTCPLVKRVHTALDRLIAEGRFPVVVGDAAHVEVRGLVGDLTDFAVILEERDLENLAEPVGRNHRLGVVAQTTQPLAHVEHLLGELCRMYPHTDVKFIDTVCQPTKDRQEAMHKLIAECDVLVVVGGPNSNNSRKLTELGLKAGRPTYQVAGPEDLRPEWFAGRHVVGLTAGTSTPDGVVHAVRTWLEQLKPASE
jgi:4-hydroxy-3-methylbut-2-enyl diphosphate reductase